MNVLTIPKNGSIDNAHFLRKNKSKERPCFISILFSYPFFWRSSFHFLSLANVISSISMNSTLFISNFRDLIIKESKSCLFHALPPLAEHRDELLFFCLFFLDSSFDSRLHFARINAMGILFEKGHYFITNKKIVPSN